MELKSKTLLQVKIGERTYEMECYSDSPLGEVHDALSQMKAYVVERIQVQLDNEKKAEEACQKSQ
jgi:hypothetical protein